MQECGLGQLICLVRPHSTNHLQPVPPRISRVTGDLTDPTSYVAELAGADTVVHLAAATGATSDSELQRVNVAATRNLLTAARDHGVGHFVQVSTIAAKAADLDSYPYGKSKLAAEEIVRNSGLAYTIIRPTIVLASNAPNWHLLRRLACLPIVPLIGGGSARVQPVDLTDVARAIAIAVTDHGPENTIVEIGGPEQLTFSEFLFRIRAACGKRGRRGIPIPYSLLRTLLRTAAGISANRFPIGPGQLVPFIADGAVTPNWLQDRIEPEMRPLDELLRDISHER